MAERYGWIGATRTERLRRAVAQCMEAWLREWAVRTDAAPDVRETAVIFLSPDEAYVLRTGSTGARLVLSVGADELALLGAGLAGVQAVDGNEIATAIATEALADLARQITRRAGLDSTAEVQDETPGPVDAMRPELGCVALRIAVGDVLVTMAFERGFIDAMCPSHPVSAASAALEQREQSIDSTAVALTAVLDFGSMAARDFFDLRPGEVLVGECPLDAPAVLHVQGAAALAEARMCKVGARRAVALMTHTNRQEKQ